MDATAGAEMAVIPAGQVTLSDRRTQRSWSVEVASFELAVFPTTRALYAELTGSRPSTAVGDQLPVESVSWWDAVRYCNALSQRDGFAPAYRLPADGDTSAGHGDPDNDNDTDPDPDTDTDTDTDGIEWDTSANGYRLPTEAEWEHACRAGTTGPRYGPLDEIAWHRGNSHEQLHAVGGKQPNPWGLHDMLGNVWDWCWDVYDAEVYGTYRVLRGGGWFDEHWSCRASVRRRSHPSYRVDDVGFRVARSIVP